MNETTRIPSHVAIIMDGNGRWARRRGKERYEGHMAGMDALRATVRNAAEYGVGYLTVYASSTENWGRPQHEVDALMHLICKGVEMETPALAEQGVRVLILGDKSRFSPEVLDALDRIESRTAQGKRMTLILALNYSSRNEIAAAARKLARKAAAGEIDPDQITEQSFGEALYTAGIPDPDLVIRTSGEYRLSNFLLWQASYAEFYFTDTLWPDFDKAEFDKAMREYASRDRRYGLVKSEPEGQTAPQDGKA